MRIARTLVLVALAAMAAMAFTATTASAQETEVEVLNETMGGAPCNPCVVHIVGESHIVATATGTEVSTCSDEFRARVYNTVQPDGGRGEVEWVGEAHGGAGCNTVNCEVMAPHWKIENVGELGGSVEHFNVDICLRNPISGAESECSVEVRVTRGPSIHHYHYSANQICPGTRVELEGESEEIRGMNESHIELVHHVN